MNTLSSIIRYTIKVLLSCTTEEQLSNATSWAVAVITNKTKDSDNSIRSDPRDCPHTRNIPPRVTTCKICSGTGAIDNDCCYQCKGSGRVIVSSDVVTYVMAFEPSHN